MGRGPARCRWTRPCFVIIAGAGSRYASRVSFRDDALALGARKDALESEVRGLRRDLERARVQARRAEVLAERLHEAERELAHLRGRRTAPGPLGALAVIVIGSVLAAAVSGLRPPRRPRWHPPPMALEAPGPRLATARPAVAYRADRLARPDARPCIFTVTHARAPAADGWAAAELLLSCPDLPRARQRRGRCTLDVVHAPDRCESTDADEAVSLAEGVLEWPSVGALRVDRPPLGPRVPDEPVP
jgi:hypothetical protein